MRLSPLVVGAARTVALTGCSAGIEAEPAYDSFSIRPVLAVGVPATDMSDSAADVIENAGVDPANEGADTLEWLRTGDCDEAAPEPTGALAVACGTAGNEVLLMGEAVLGTESIAAVDFMRGEPEQLALNLDNAGAEALADMTATARELPAPENRIAIMVDGEVVAAPQVRDSIESGEFVISGGDLGSVAEALKALAN